MKNLFLFALLFISSLCFAQDADKTVSITVSGSGKTQEDAKQSALRSAIEQAFGTFISSKTEILNDKVVVDQMASISNGNIQSYTILNEGQLPDGSWGVTLKAMVSVSKLTSFVEAKGIEINVKGEIFALNIEQQILNEKSEDISIVNLIDLLKSNLITAFDFEIVSSDPVSNDSNNINWTIPLKVFAIANKNMKLISNYLLKSLDLLNLSPDEIEYYRSLNKNVYPIDFNINDSLIKFYLRKQESVLKIKKFVSTWYKYTRLFKIYSGSDEINPGFGVNVNYHEFYNINNTDNSIIPIKLLDESQQAATFSLRDIKTLTQIKNLSHYKIIPIGTNHNLESNNLNIEAFKISDLNFYTQIDCENFLKKKFKFKIIDRWGVCVFETSDPFFTKWNGYYNGKAQDFGTYSFILDYTCSDGKIDHKQGTFVLDQY